jgi:hypothetical protein
MLTVMCVLALSAFITVVIAAAGRCPLFVPVLILAVLELLRCLPK